MYRAVSIAALHYQKKKTKNKNIYMGMGGFILREMTLASYIC
jgi:hypothetical protein